MASTDSPVNIVTPSEALTQWRTRQPVWLRGLGASVDFSVIVIGATLIGLIFLNVVLHAFARDLAWLTELGELLMVWVTFLGGVSAAQRDAHMCITEFLDKLPTERRRWADLSILLLCAALLVLMLVYGLRVVNSSWGSTLTTLEWPIAWQYMPLPLGAALMLVFLAWDAWQVWHGVPREQRYPAD